VEKQTEKYKGEVATLRTSAPLQPQKTTQNVAAKTQLLLIPQEQKKKYFTGTASAPHSCFNSQQAEQTHPMTC